MTLKAFVGRIFYSTLWRGKRLFGKKSGLLKRHRTTTYASYRQAMDSCVTRSGYEDSILVKVVFEKTKAFIERLNEDSVVELSPTDAFALLPFLRMNRNDELRVIDVGGACGAHYFIARKIVNLIGPLRWCVVETKEMYNCGKFLENSELCFSDNLHNALKDAGRVDLLFTSGTLQCVENPYNFLKDIVNSGAEYILFNRLGLTEGSMDVITTHSSMLSENGIGPLPEGFVDCKVEYPFNFVQKKRFDSIVKEKYEYIIVWSDQTGIFPVNDEPIVGMGLLCKRKQ